MNDEKYFKVIETREFVVKAESLREAIAVRKVSSSWQETDVNGYELTDSDLEKYDITNEVKS